MDGLLGSNVVGIGHCRSHRVQVHSASGEAHSRGNCLSDYAPEVERRSGNITYACHSQVTPSIEHYRTYDRIAEREAANLEAHELRIGLLKAFYGEVAATWKAKKLRFWVVPSVRAVRSIRPGWL